MQCFGNFRTFEALKIGGVQSFSTAVLNSTDFTVSLSGRIKESGEVERKKTQGH